MRHLVKLGREPWAPAGALREPAALHAPELEVHVIFTTVRATLMALRRAGELAKNLNARIIILVPHVVPYPLPLNAPPVLVGFTERRFRTVLGPAEIATCVRIYLCRDPLSALEHELKPNALVVLAGPKRFWPTQEARLARTLRVQGHHVLFSTI